MTKRCEQNTSQVVFVLLAEHVALPANGADVAGASGVRLYLLPQTAYGGVDPTCLLFVIYIHILKSLFHEGAALTELSGVIIQVKQQVEF